MNYIISCASKRDLSSVIVKFGLNLQIDPVLNRVQGTIPV